MVFCPRDQLVYDNYCMAIRTLQDFPKPGVLFFSLNQLISDRQQFYDAVSDLSRLITNLPEANGRRHRGLGFNKILAPEARGFVWGSVTAYLHAAGLVLARKNGKNLLPPLAEVNYDTEYSSDRLAIEAENLSTGDGVVIVDDVLATGGTLLALAKMVEECGARVAGIVTVMDLIELGGAERLKDAGYDVRTLISFHTTGSLAPHGVWE